MRCSPGLLFASLLGAVLLLAAIGCTSNPTTSGNRNPSSGPAASSDKKPDTPKDGATSGRPPFKPGD
jgi:hypothetical protein